MELDEVRRVCLAKPGATETYPFGPDALVVKVADRIFAIVAEDAAPVTISLECEPEVAVLLRDTYPAVAAGPGSTPRLRSRTASSTTPRAATWSSV